MLLKSRIDQIRHYLNLADVTREKEYLAESCPCSENEDAFQRARAEQNRYLSDHNIKRSEIDEYHKRNRLRVNDAKDAVRAILKL